MTKISLVFYMLGASLIYANEAKQAILSPEARTTGAILTGPGMAPSRVLVGPTIWFPMVTPTEISANANAEPDPAKGLPPLACQTITIQGAGYSSITWSGLNLPLPENRLLHIPIYLDDFRPAGGYSLSLTIQLTNANGAISYGFSANSIKTAGWSYLPLWDPSTPANAVFNKPGTSWVTTDTGFDFSQPVTSIRIVPNNLPAGEKISIASIETATKTKPILVVTNDITDDSTYLHIVPIMEAAGFRGGLRIGGAKDHAFSESNMEKLRKAYDDGWDVYNGSWSRTGLNGSTTKELFESEILECQKKATALGFTRGMTWFSSAGNGIPSQSLCRAVGAELGMNVFKSGGGMGFVNIVRANGVDRPAILTSTGMGSRGMQQATGRRSESTITVTNNRTLREGSAVSGPGIGIGARISPHGVNGNTITLTVPNIDDIAGSITVADSYEANKALADGLVYTGGALIYFMHDLKPVADPPSIISFPVEDFTKLVAYWKTLSDSGLLEVVTPSQFDAIMHGER